MFYLGKEDIAEEQDLIGKGLRGMFGVQNKEEAVESVLRRTNPDDPASREAALREIASIDPDAWSRVSGIFQELDKGRLGIQEKQLDIKAKVGESDRNLYWRTKVEPNAIAELASRYGIEANNMPEIIKILNAAVDSGKMKSGSRTAILTDMKNDLKEREKAWKLHNKYRDFSSISRGLSNVTTTSPSDKKAEKIDPTTTTKDPSYVPPTQEEYDSDPRPIWQKGTIWNYRRPKKADTNSDNVGGA